MSKSVIQDLLILLVDEADVTQKRIADEIGKSPSWVSREIKQARGRDAINSERKVHRPNPDTLKPDYSQAPGLPERE